MLCLSLALLGLASGLTASPRAWAQSPPVTAKSFDNAPPTRCEDSINILDSLTQRTAPDELIFVIARLGDKETRANIGRRRLHNVRAYLTEYLTEPRVRRKPETIILAEGERVRGLGQIELYAGGKLFWVLKIRRNADLVVGTCYPDGDSCPPEDRNLYPCRDKHGPARNRGRAR